MQCILSALVAIIIALAPVFNIPLTVVPPKGELPHESEPAPSELSVYDKVVGVDDSVFHISRPNVENLKTIYASDFGMDSNSQDNTDAFCRAIDYCCRNPGARLVIDAGEYRFSPKNTIGLNLLKDVLIDAEGAVFVFDCDRYFEISGCENFEIKGLAVDWAWDESRLASVVKIEKRNTIKHTFDMRFTELDEVPENIAVMAMTQLDPRTLTFGAQTYCGVAEVDGKALGLYILHPNNIGRCGHICNASYAVSSKSRGQHIGEKLVLDCIRQAHEEGFRVLQFNAVVRTNIHARHLYERIGFKQLGTIPGGFRIKDGSYEDICPYYIEV